MRSLRRLPAALVMILIGGCGGGGGGSGKAAPTTTRANTRGAFRLSSPAFAAGGPIPRAYTCDGADVSPPLRWSTVPHGSRELVLIMRDPDAPGGNFVHWAVAGISPTTSGLATGRLSGAVILGRNSFGTLGYRGPCPPTGSPHHYVITLRALAGTLGLAAGFKAGQLRAPALGTATLIGTYGRR